MADSTQNDGVRIDNLRLRVPSGGHFAGLGPQSGEQLAMQIGSGLELGSIGSLSLERLRVRIPEHELGNAPADAIARAINRELRGGVR